MPTGGVSSGTAVRPVVFGVHQVHGPRPRDVAGFAHALADGKLPRVPRTPPRLLPGITADRAFWRWIGVCVGAGALWFVTATQGIPRLGLSALWAGLLMLGSGLTVFSLWLQAWRGFGALNARELEHGYTTLVLTLGGLTSIGSRDESGHSHTPWDYSGIWVLGNDGRVLSPPDPSKEPPGFYPSPHEPGRFELWTGCAWSGQVRD